MSNSEHKKALLLVAHGSRRAASNDEIRELAEHLASSQENPFYIVEAAFLELAQPSIPEGIEYCIQHGAEEVLVFPYFLSAGRHVTEDIPAEVEKTQKQYPGVEVSIVNYLGIAAGMPRMIFDHLRSQ